jgi:hypothetical protein
MFNENDNIEFEENEESKRVKKSISVATKKSKRSNNIHQSNGIISEVDESSVIKSRHKNKSSQSKVNEGDFQLKNNGQLDQSQSMISVLNFHPDHLIANNGIDSIAMKSLQYINDLHRLKNKRQLSEVQAIRISSQMKKIFHKHHLSNPNSKFAGIGESQIRKMENMNGGDFMREMSNFMDPRDIISMFSMDQRKRPLDHNPTNSIQLSTLSTNPKKRQQDNKKKYEGSYNSMNGHQNLELDDKDPMVHDDSAMYDEVLLEDEETPTSGPNEAMYIDIDQIPVSLMLTFEEAIQRQKEILDKSSKVNNYTMPLWDSRKHNKYKFYKYEQADSNETDNIFQSVKHMPEYQLYKMDEIKSDPSIISSKLNPLKIIMGSMKSSISVACSLISICNYDQQFDKTTIGTLIYPNKDDSPMINKYGNYGVKVGFNGAQRLVLVEDKMPFTKDRQPILTYHGLEFATQILEKAIIKLYGRCYNTINTNPSIEMHHFIGWIPETVKFSDVNNKENLWSRMKQNFKEGNIILSINEAGDDEEAKFNVFDSKLTQDDSPLLAVLDIREFKEHKLIK